MIEHLDAIEKRYNDISEELKQLNNQKSYVT